MKRTAFCAVLFLLSASAFAAQRTFVSAAAGADTNPCTPQAPCRTFAAAAAVTNLDGEVVAVDSGGYGPVTITQALSLIAPGGVYAGITAVSGNAISVDAGDTGQVVLRNLALIGLGADNGIEAIAGDAALYVENCTIGGFGLAGIYFAPTTPNPSLYASQTTIASCGDSGVNIHAGNAQLDSLILRDNKQNAVVFLATALIRNSVASGGSFYGYFSDTGANVTIVDSAATGNFIGYFADTGNLYLERCTASGNTEGLEADSQLTTMVVSDSVITGNATGIVIPQFATITSRGNNTVRGNGTDGAFNATIAPH